MGVVNATWQEAVTVARNAVYLSIQTCFLSHPFKTYSFLLLWTKSILGRTLRKQKFGNDIRINRMNYFPLYPYFRNKEHAYVLKFPPSNRWHSIFVLVPITRAILMKSYWIWFWQSQYPNFLYPLFTHNLL